MQALALPLTLAGRDVAGQAQTGTGKTIALPRPRFIISFSPSDCRPQSNQPRALLWRRRGTRGAKSTRTLSPGAGHRPETGLAYGGDGYDKQLKVLESGVDILIGTTGVFDYANRTISTSAPFRWWSWIKPIACTILGFIKDIRWLFRRMPPANSVSICCSPQPFLIASANWRSNK
ncbi:DEAD/DEAH box helicase [Shigella flexneri]